MGASVASVVGAAVVGVVGGEVVAGARSVQRFASQNGLLLGQLLQGTPRS